MTKESWSPRKEKLTKKRANICVNTIDFPACLEFLKLHFMVEAKIVTLPDVVLNVYRQKI